ncbi:MAG: HIT family protein [Actinobacteria bacterium]|mgnify:CR=1 FL=1|jgi:histidine triad (HIT) family protein|nr:HIT family protein [Actinomycetota bacterium]MCO5299202.1 HIT family protein [Candidatus Nanopelagicales bacterium]MCB9429514.1 HIT family protein [Actinomycetota bacterium]HPE11685.1 HIT family protein [Actinomycetota bacterium]HPJ17496.1 HIT family protein [Actinomycetota bacterium]
MTCIFCAIVAGDLPSHQIAETDRALAFMDINPATRGHALVIPKKHAADLIEIAPDELAACSALAQDIAGRALDRLGADGVNLVNACGVAAWQTVFHFHIHVVPRYAGRDGLEMPWIPTPGDPVEIAEAGALLR